jgi:hypothetical protein
MYSSTIIVQVIKLRKMRLAGHVVCVCVGERRGIYRVLMGET